MIGRPYAEALAELPGRVSVPALVMSALQPLLWFERRGCTVTVTGDNAIFERVGRLDAATRGDRPAWWPSPLIDPAIWRTTADDTAILLVWLDGELAATIAARRRAVDRSVGEDVADGSLLWPPGYGCAWRCRPGALALSLTGTPVMVATALWRRADAPLRPTTPAIWRLLVLYGLLSWTWTHLIGWQADWMVRTNGLGTQHFYSLERGYRDGEHEQMLMAMARSDADAMVRLPMEIAA